MSEKDFGIIAIIAARKSRFYERTRDTLLKELPLGIFEDPF